MDKKVIDDFRSVIIPFHYAFRIFNEVLFTEQILSAFYR